MNISQSSSSDPEVVLLARFLVVFGAERFLSSFSTSSDHRTLSLFLKDVGSNLVDFVDCFSSIASWPREGANFFFRRNTSLNLQVSGLPRFSNFTILAMALAIGRTSKSFFVVLGFGTVTKRRGPPIYHLTLSNVVVMLMF